MSDVMNKQIGGSHYKCFAYQPITLSYDIGASPSFVLALRYLARDKANRKEDFEKAIHCIELEKEHIKQRTMHYRVRMTLDEIGEIVQFCNQFEDAAYGDWLSGVLHDIYLGFSDLAIQRIKEYLEVLVD